MTYHSSSRFSRDAASRLARPPHKSGGHATSPDKNKTKPAKPEQKELVVASLSGDDTSWLDEFFGSWRKNIYVVNNVSAPLTVPVNKGREAMPFLTYIIDRYDSLPNVSIFIHSLRYQWHNEDPMYDGVPVLKRLRLKHVQKRGFVALRCSWTMGCPSELHPLRPSGHSDDRSQNEAAYASVFRYLFPGETVPDVVGAHCSSQFAVSRERVRARSKKQYEKIRNWLLETQLQDQISGRVIEYMWHIIFGMPAVDCQDAGECFCETFGLCNLTCTERECEKRYKLPQFATIPEGWPEVGPGESGWPEKGWAD
ncbi:uncharacterized protein BDR25DRAFT_309419 [Lindgomyces ingoldianus]|uniref:Uncharacterized protein n=1 Tax=Lindgomyces ingoldianus TaxID=673940 RepID=A0ACB6RDD7_9PLEO|nr:uncharacterized protein BDR25DRAFT_309419 [Lindgomyces ingoldianus]KAF2477122.1 hypothetical protein BDR25DRAFT_309419 [Lindgomyces ingoldianus]